MTSTKLKKKSKSLEKPSQQDNKQHVGIVCMESVKESGDLDSVKERLYNISPGAPNRTVSFSSRFYDISSDNDNGDSDSTNYKEESPNANNLFKECENNYEEGPSSVHAANLITQLKTEIDSLRLENAKLEELRVENAQLSAEKLQVTQELEELTKSLFEEANSLVASEAKARYFAELQVSKLEKQLLENKIHLAEEMQQLDELKRKMELLSLEKSATTGSLSFLHLKDCNDPENPIPLSIWNLFSPKELQDISYPEMSFSETKKIFYKRILRLERNFVKNVQYDETHETQFVMESDKVHEVAYDREECQVEISEISPPELSKEQILKPEIEGLNSSLTRQSVNEMWLYTHFDGHLLNEFLQCLGRLSNGILGKRKSIDYIHSNTNLFIEKSSVSRSSTSLQIPGTPGTQSPMNVLSRPQTPNPFGSLVNGGKSKAAPLPPIYRAFPGEYKRTGDPFLKRVYDEDIYPTLMFALRGRPFVKQVLAVVAANKLAFEKQLFYVDQFQNPVESHPGDTLSASLDGESVLLSSKATSSREKFPCCEFCGREILPKPSMFLDLDDPSCHSDADVTFQCSGSTHESTSKFSCEAYRLLIEDPQMASSFGKSFYVLDSLCRDKIVAVCDFFAFIRYYKAGLYQNLSNESLFVKWLHLKRNLFHARLGAAAYFVAHDINKLVHLAEKKL